MAGNAGAFAVLNGLFWKIEKSWIGVILAEAWPSSTLAGCSS